MRQLRAPASFKCLLTLAALASASPDGYLTECVRNTMGGCTFGDCDPWRGPTYCHKYVGVTGVGHDCVCKPGYCSNKDGVCIRDPRIPPACNVDTGGTCIVFSCHPNRGPTSCSKEHECLCQEGYCSDLDGVCRPDPKWTCHRDTGGTCAIWNCYPERGPTMCLSGVCMCQDGYCSNGQGKCVPPISVRTNSSIATNFDAIPPRTRNKSDLEEPEVFNKTARRVGFCGFALASVAIFALIWCKPRHVGSMAKPLVEA